MSRRRLLMRSIKLAARPGLFIGSSRTDGLRAVQLFEMINGISPDPRNLTHAAIITNTGWYFALQRRLKKARCAAGA